MNNVNAKLISEDEIAKLKALVADAEASHQQAKAQSNENELEALALDVKEKATLIDALNQTTYEQQMPVMKSWDAIYMAARELDRVNRGLFVGEALTRTGFDVELIEETDKLILNALNARISAIERYKQESIERGELITRYLSPIADRYRNKVKALDLKIGVKESRIETASNSRLANLETLLDMGVPREVAESSAKPTEAEVSVFKKELEELKQERERCYKVTRSAQLQAEVAFPN